MFSTHPDRRRKIARDYVQVVAATQGFFDELYKKEQDKQWYP
jgi:hypothetical protein